VASGAGVTDAGAVREVVEGSSGGALTAAGVASFFAGKVRARQVQPLLESLAELALVRVDAEA
jgi:TctA family transporter